MTNVCCCEEQNQSEELRVYDWALLDNTDKIPKDKLPNDVYTKDEINTIIGPIGPVSVKSYVDGKIATINPQAPVEFPEITIIDGYWYINGLKAAKVTGDQGTQGPRGDKGDQGDQGPQGNAGKSAYEIAKDNGFIGTEAQWLESLTPKISINSEGYWCINDENTGVKAKGEKGSSGADGKSGATIEVINDHWIINGRDYGPIRGAEGRGIRSIRKTGLEDDWTDIYTITYTDNSFDTFKVINGKNGEKGDKGDKGDDGLDGLNGKNGVDGASGTNTYFHIAYANKNSHGDIIDFSTTDPTLPNGGYKEYIGTYVDSNLPDSDDPRDYTWMLIRGAQGADGTNGIPGTDGKDGEDGRTQYLHIKYSNDGGRTFTDNNGETPGSYLGQYVDFNEHDELNVSYYKWSLIKGEPGKDGKDGVGINIKGSLNSENELPQSGNEAGDAYFVGEYIFVWNGTIWKNMGRIAGGGSGGNGETLYLHIAYANSDDGSIDFSVIDDKSSGIIHNYLGICVNDEVEDPGYDRRSEYTWTLIRGAQGDPGADGTTFEFIYTRNNGDELGNPNPPTKPFYDSSHRPVKEQDDWYGEDSAGITWTDNPQGVEKYKKYEYVSTRAKKNGIWSDFSPPVVWSSWGKDGLDGDGFEYIYTVTTESLNNPTSPTPSNWRDSSSVYQTVNEFVNYIPLELSGYSWTWTDDPQQLTSINKYQWVSVRKRTNGVWDLFSTPVIWSKWSEKGTDGGHWEKRYKVVGINDGIPDKPTNDGTTNGWVLPGVIETVDETQVIYESECFVDGDGNYGEWTNPLRITGGSSGLSEYLDLYLSFDKNSKVTTKTLSFKYDGYSNGSNYYYLYYANNQEPIKNVREVIIENATVLSTGKWKTNFTTIELNDAGRFIVSVDRNENSQERTSIISIISHDRLCTLFVKLEGKPLPSLTINSTGPGYVLYGTDSIRNTLKLYTMKYGPEDAKLTFNPNLNSYVKSFEVSGIDRLRYIADNQYTITSIDEDTTALVEFEAYGDDKCTLTIISSGQGNVKWVDRSISVINLFRNINVDKNREITLVLEPFTNYLISTVKLNNIDVTTDVINSTYTFIPLGDCIVKVTFEPKVMLDSKRLTISHNGYGSVKYGDEEILGNLRSFDVAIGNTVVLIFQPNEGYGIASLMVNGSPVVCNNNQYIITNFNLDTNIDITFDVKLIEEDGYFTWENGLTEMDLTLEAESTSVIKYFYYNNEVLDLGKNNIVSTNNSNYFEEYQNGIYCVITPNSNMNNTSRYGVITYRYKNLTITLNITQKGATNDLLIFNPSSDAKGNGDRTVFSGKEFNILGQGTNNYSPYTNTGVIQSVISEDIANSLTISLKDISNTNVIQLGPGESLKNERGYYISREWDEKSGLSVNIKLSEYTDAINTYANAPSITLNGKIGNMTFNNMKVYASGDILDAARTIGIKEYILEVKDSRGVTGKYILEQIPNHWIKATNNVVNFGLPGFFVMGKSVKRINGYTDNGSSDSQLNLDKGAIFFGRKDSTGYCGIAENHTTDLEYVSAINRKRDGDFFGYGSNSGDGEFWIILLDNISDRKINLFVSSKLGDNTHKTNIESFRTELSDRTIKLLKRVASDSEDEIAVGTDVANNYFQYIRRGSYSFRYTTDNDWYLDCL